jgi:hypothetical protein
MSGEIVEGAEELINWGINTYYDIKYKNEIRYANGSIGALNKADLLVKAACRASTFPSLLINNLLPLRISRIILQITVSPTAIFRML